MPNFPPVEPGLVYHVCTRGNNRNPIFLADQDRRHFLQLCQERIVPAADLFAYCLLPNHFHLLLRFHAPPDPEPAGYRQPSRVLADMLNAYARAFNLDHGRVGAVFQRPFRRVRIRTQEQLTHVVVYIHHNPQRHGLADGFRTWKFSSFAALRSAGATLLARDEVHAWFGGASAFTSAHLSPTPAPSQPELELERELLPTT
jgi:REP element-mobilizing transposase RayT